MAKLKILAFLIPFLAIPAVAGAQCEVALDITDEFDTTRTIVSSVINIGYVIPSEVLTMDGPKMVEEAKLLFSYSENDTISSFFLTLAMPERDFLVIESGKSNVLLAFSNEQVEGLLNVPDRGEFDPRTNMRLYQHTCVVPLDVFYVMMYQNLEKIRVRYRTYKHTITILPEQQKAIRAAVRCVGEQLGLFPAKP